MKDIKRFDIAPQVRNLWIIDKFLQFKFRTFFLQSLDPDNFPHQIVTSSSYSRQLFCKLSFLTPFLQIVVLDLFGTFCKSSIWTTSLQIVVADNVFADCCCKQFILQICKLWQLCYNLLFRINLLQICKLQPYPPWPLQSTRPTQTSQASDYSGHFDHPHHLYHFDHFCFALVV